LSAAELLSGGRGVVCHGGRLYGLIEDRRRGTKALCTLNLCAGGCVSR
jgi:hypothetical protein